MTTLVQKGLLGLTVLMTVGVLLALFASKRYVFDPRKRDSLLLEMISNVSSDLDKMDANFDGISQQIDLAKYRLGRLMALHRENLLLCAILRERRKKKAKTTASSSETSARPSGSEGHSVLQSTDQLD